MRIKFIKSAVAIGYAHFEGSEATYPDALAQEFIDTGYAVAIQEEIETATKTPVAEKAVQSFKKNKR